MPPGNEPARHRGRSQRTAELDTGSGPHVWTAGWHPRLVPTKGRWRHVGVPLAGRPAQCRWEQGFMERCVAGQNVAQHVGAWTSRRPTLGTLQNRPPQGRRENCTAAPRMLLPFVTPAHSRWPSLGKNAAPEKSRWGRGWGGEERVPRGPTARHPDGRGTQARTSPRGRRYPHFHM